jgi:hypothetical protein
MKKIALILVVIMATLTNQRAKMDNQKLMCDGRDSTIHLNIYKGKAYGDGEKVGSPVASGYIVQVKPNLYAFHAMNYAGYEDTGIRFKTNKRGKIVKAYRTRGKLGCRVH